MRIGCLQFAPVLGDVDNNLNRADAVLSKSGVKELDLLVLPELAFSGYNFKSLTHIMPYLEPTTSGVTSLWARTIALKYDCVVSVGYPEKVDISPKWPTSPEYYSSTITVNRDGETIANYRKSFLYYTDESWALEGPDGFYSGEIEDLGNVAMGICKWPTKCFERMDLNPYKFEAPWSAWEFAYHILHREANLAIISMAWVTREDARSYSRSPKDPDMETLAYWVARLEPVIRSEGEKEIICVFANRCGVEDDVVYAGTSAVLGIQHGEVKLYGILGRGEKELLVVDTSKRPQAKLVHDSHSNVGQPLTTKTKEKGKARPTTPAVPNAADQLIPSRDSNSSAASRSSTGSKNSLLAPLMTHSSTTSNASNASDASSTGATSGTAHEDDDDAPMSSIGEVLASTLPLSPVEPRGGHVFFGGREPTPAERQVIKSSVEVKQDVPVELSDLSIAAAMADAQATKNVMSPSIPVPPRPVQRPDISSNGTIRPLKSAVNGTSYPRSATPGIDRSTTPGVDQGTFERPSSPKSRNASRNREFALLQEPALRTHDLAGEFPESRSISRNQNSQSGQGFSLPERNQTPQMVRGGNTYGGRSDDGPRSAGDAELNLPVGVEIVHSDSESEDEDRLKVPGRSGESLPRPRSVGW